jgi:hypothetical protein
MFESLRANHGYTKLFLFHYDTEAVPASKYPSTLIEFIDIAQIKNQAFASNGFTSFLSLRLAEIYEIKGDTFKIKMLEAAIEFLKYREDSAPAIVQLRGMFGRIFSAWVNRDNCISWAWADLDILVGDLKGFL